MRSNPRRTNTPARGGKPRLHITSDFTSELKATDFEPEYLGALGTYVTMVDGLVRNPEIHAPTIGLLLCTGKREATVRFALASTAAPVAVAEWQTLPDDARAALPSAHELEAVVKDELAHQTALHADAVPPRE
ncbi:MAG: DUF1016 domain-containing protein [Bifidobacteriaceae bacterium]|jgi:hypothetical protein|nr:DUF1016 domain-containing protein [Bifidobacteriaceae bacterium]